MSCYTVFTEVVSLWNDFGYDLEDYQGFVYLHWNGFSPV